MFFCCFKWLEQYKRQLPFGRVISKLRHPRHPACWLTQYWTTDQWQKGWWRGLPGLALRNMKSGDAFEFWMKSCYVVMKYNVGEFVHENWEYSFLFGSLSDEAAFPDLANEAASFGLKPGLGGVRARADGNHKMCDLLKSTTGWSLAIDLNRPWPLTVFFHSKSN